MFWAYRTVIFWGNYVETNVRYGAISWCGVSHHKKMNNMEEYYGVVEETRQTHRNVTKNPIKIPIIYGAYNHDAFLHRKRLGFFYKKYKKPLEIL